MGETGRRWRDEAPGGGGECGGGAGGRATEPESGVHPPTEVAPTGEK